MLGFYYPLPELDENILSNSLKINMFFICAPETLTIGGIAEDGADSVYENNNVKTTDLPLFKAGGASDGGPYPV